jgi:hypothetical protein
MRTKENPSLLLFSIAVIKTCQGTPPTPGLILTQFNLCYGILSCIKSQSCLFMPVQILVLLFFFSLVNQKKCCFARLRILDTSLAAMGKVCSMSLTVNGWSLPILGYNLRRVLDVRFGFAFLGGCSDNWEWYLTVPAPPLHRHSP